jgi:pyruvate ferredoxin oxidoreductase delta subunit
MLLSSEQKGVATAWRDLLPACDSELCTCTVCLAAVHCPESVIRWQDGRIAFDLDFCKACGTCARECPRSAITMEPVAEVARG